MEDISIDDIGSISEVDIRDMFNDIELSDSIPIQELEDTKNKDTQKICTSCNTEDYIVEDTSNGFLVCSNCGQVLEELIDQHPERHNYDNESNDVRSHHAVSKLLPVSGLGTHFGGNWRSRMRKLHEWNIMPYKERSLSYVFKELHEKCKKGNLMKCIEDDAKIMYKSISECKHTKGKNKGRYIIIRGANRKSLIAACIFFACRRKHMTRSPKEIAGLFELKYTDMTKGCKNFLKLMKIKQMGMNIGTSKPEDFVIRFCLELKLKQQYSDQAVMIAKNIRKIALASDHTPYSIATGSILLMAEINKLYNITKKKLSTSFEVSEVTITKTYKKIEPYKTILIDDNLTEKMSKDMISKVKDIEMSDKLKERFKKYNIDHTGSTKINIKDIIDTESSIEEEEEEYIKEEVQSDEELEFIDPNLYSLYKEMDIIDNEYNEIINNLKNAKIRV